MSTVIEHLEPEENYGGGDYDDEEEEEEFDEEEYVEEEETEYEVEYIEGPEIVEESTYDCIEEEPPSGGGVGMAALIAAAANKRNKNRLDQGGVSSSSSTQQATTRSNYNPPQQYQTSAVATVQQQQEEDDDDGGGGGMAAMIAAAANKRKSRLDQGGEKKITHVEPAPNKGMDMAAIVALKAKERNDRVEAGGEIKVREIPKEHKCVFVDVALEAARIGQLTRLEEHTVTAVAVAKEEEVWGGPSGLRTDHLRSVMFMAVNEAAAMGAMKMRKAVEVTNYDQNAYYEEQEPEDIDKMVDDQGRKVLRTHHLLDRHVEERRKEKEEEWAAENQIHVQYDSIDQVALPSKTAPKWKPKKTVQTHKDLMESISLGVAERAWERNYRLGRPKALLRVTRKCTCKFCVNPNPYQTHKYKMMVDQGIEESDGPLLPAPEDPRTKKWKPPRGTPAPSEFRGYDPIRSEPKTEKSAPIPKVKFKPNKPPPKPISDEGPPTPAPIQPTEEEPVNEYDDEDDDGPVVLLDETTTWGHKREKTPKPPKEKLTTTKKKTTKTKKKKKKGGKDDGCSIM